MELGIANLDMRDIMIDRGFWDRVGSGGMVYGLPDWTPPGSDIEPGAGPDGGGPDGGPFPPRDRFKGKKESEKHDRTTENKGGVLRVVL